MYTRLLQATAGKLYWMVLQKKYQADKYIFFPEEKAEYFQWGMKLLPQYIVQHQLRRLLVLSTGDFVGKHTIDGGITTIQFKKITNRAMDCLMRCYALTDLSRQWVVVSTRQPYDTGAERLLGINGVTYRDIVYYDIYQYD